jgi:hypothetical protein
MALVMKSHDPPLSAAGEPSGTPMLLALDASGLMTWGAVAGAPGLSPRDASAAMERATAWAAAQAARRASPR